MNLTKRLLSVAMAFCFGALCLPSAEMMPLILPQTVCAEEAFSYTEVRAEHALTYRVYEDHAEVCKSDPYSEAAFVKELVIPAEFEGVPVTAVCGMGFSGYTMHSVTLPDTLTSLCRCAFADCIRLESITIPTGVTTIPESAFSGCTALRSIDLPEGITRIASNAFFGCSSLTAVELPDGLEIIDSSAFSYCTSLSEVRFPDSLKGINDWAFGECSALEEAVLPEGLEWIRPWAFYHCTSLQSVTLPAFRKFQTEITLGEGENAYEITTDCLDKDAFYCCTALSEFRIAPGSTCYSVRDGLLCNPEGDTLILAPAGMQADTYTIPSGITSIGSNAFSQCSGIRKLCIPETVTNIEPYAFSYMLSVEEIEFLDTLPFFPDHLFFSSGNLQRIRFPAALKRIGERAFCETGFTELTIPDSVEAIEQDAMTDMPELTHLTFGKNVRFCIIYGGLTDEELIMYSNYSPWLHGDTALTEITVPEENPYYSVREGAMVYSKDSTVLYACSPGIVTPVLRIPDGTVMINDYALAEAQGFQEVILPAGIRDLKSYCFYHSSLEALTFLDDADVGQLTLEDDCLRDTPFLNHYKETCEDGWAITENGILLSAPRNQEELVIPANVRAFLQNGFGEFGGVLFAPTTIFEGDFRLPASNTIMPIEHLVIKGDAYFPEGAISNWESLQTVEVGGDCTVEIGYDDITIFDNNDTITDWVVDGELHVEGCLRGSITHLSYQRPEMQYRLGDNPSGAASKASATVRTLGSEFPRYYETASYSIPTYAQSRLHVDYLQELQDGKGNCYALVNPGNKTVGPVYLFPEDPSLEPVVISREDYYFGCSAMDTDGTLYILWGINTDYTSGEDSLVLCKYDINGKLLGECGIPADFTHASNPFTSGNAAMVLTNGMAVFQYATHWNNKNVQGSGVCAVDTSTMTEVRNDNTSGAYGNGIGTENTQTFRHSFSNGICMIPTKYGTFSLDQNESLFMDAYIAGDGQFTLDRIRNSFSPYNRMFYDPDVYLCGLTASSSTIAFAGLSTLAPSGRRNAFVRVVDQNLTGSADDLAGEDITYRDESDEEHITHNVIWLTDIPEDGEVGTVRITTLGDGAYCAMWEQRIGTEGSVWYTVLDECGNRLRRPTRLENARLSNTSVQPIADGTRLKWATLSETALTWYTVDLADAGEVAPQDGILPGDVNFDGSVNATDAAQVLIAAANSGAGKDAGLTDKQQAAADVNADGSINATDAAIILQYAAAVGAGQKDVKITDFVKNA